MAVPRSFPKIAVVEILVVDGCKLLRSIWSAGEGGEDIEVA